MGWQCWCAPIGLISSHFPLVVSVYRSTNQRFSHIFSFTHPQRWEKRAREGKNKQHFSMDIGELVSELNCQWNVHLVCWFQLHLLIELSRWIEFLQFWQVTGVSLWSKITTSAPSLSYPVAQKSHGYIYFWAMPTPSLSFLSISCTGPLGFGASPVVEVLLFVLVGLFWRLLKLEHISVFNTPQIHYTTLYLEVTQQTKLAMTPN